MSRIYPSTDFKRIEPVGNDRFPRLLDPESYAKSNKSSLTRFFIFLTAMTQKNWGLNPFYKVEK